MDRKLVMSDGINVVELYFQTRYGSALGGIEALGVMFLYDPATKTVFQDPSPDQVENISTVYSHLNPAEIRTSGAAVGAVIKILTLNWR